MEKLEDINVPTLIIVGELDVELRSMADTMEHRIPDAQKIIFDGVGHMSNMEVPDIFNKTVLHFLSGINTTEKSTK